jgi:hypothetical protein
MFLYMSKNYSMFLNFCAKGDIYDIGYKTKTLDHSNKTDTASISLTMQNSLTIKLKAILTVSAIF